MKCTYPPCTKSVTRPRSQYCSTACGNAHWKERNREHVNEQALALYHERKQIREPSDDWPTRRAKIIKKYGVKK
jgi:hypothetical protein